MTKRCWGVGLVVVALPACDLFQTVDPCMNGNCTLPLDGGSSATPTTSAFTSTTVAMEAGVSAHGTASSPATPSSTPIAASTSASATPTSLSDGAVSASAAPDGGPPPCGACADGVCHPVTHVCVACWAGAAAEDAAADDGCPAEAPRCLEPDDAPAACVACLTDDDCDGETPLCNTATHSCVSCESNTDCPDPAAAYCDAAGRCAPCDPADTESDGAHAACTHLTGTDICHAGTCVACDAQFDQACGDAVCTLTPGDAQFTCALERLKDSAGACDPCVNDTECHPGAGCVPVVFGEDNLATGYHCLFRVDPDLTGTSEEIIASRDQTGVRDCGDQALPYLTQKYYTSLTSDEVAPFCQPGASTCLALNQYRTTPCGTSGSEAGGVEECGLAGVDDAVCQAFTESKERCSPRCIGDEDCAGFSCSGSVVNPGYCAFN